MILFPRAQEADLEDGWTLDPTFLSQIRERSEQNGIPAPVSNDVEAVLLALESLVTFPDHNPLTPP